MRPTFLLIPLCCLAWIAFIPVSAMADGCTNEEAKRKPYPGEEVETSGGRKARVWSTEGPVPVSPPPEPFDTPDSSPKIDEIDVVVPAVRKSGGKGGAHRDSFDVD